VFFKKKGGHKARPFVARLGADQSSGSTFTKAASWVAANPESDRGKVIHPDPGGLPVAKAVHGWITMASFA
jgi:hypothetical protein